MRTLRNPSREGYFHFEFEDRILRMYFPFKQIDIIQKHTLLYKHMAIYNMFPISEAEEVIVFNRSKELLEHLKLEIDNTVKIYYSKKNKRTFLIGKEDKFIQVDSEIEGACGYILFK